MVFQILAPVYIAMLAQAVRGEEDKPKSNYSKKEAKQLAKQYKNLLNTFNEKCGFSDYQYNITEDPWSPGIHCICIEQKQKFLGNFFEPKRTSIAQIVSEPKFAEGYMDVSNLTYEGFKIIARSKALPLVEELVQAYELTFNEKATILPFQE